jgi:microcystin degradation protein MlrC
LPDFEDAGVSVIVVTDNDVALADQVANHIAAANLARARRIRVPQRATGSIDSPGKSDAI